MYTFILSSKPPTEAFTPLQETKWATIQPRDYFKMAQ